MDRYSHPRLLKNFQHNPSSKTFYKLQYHGAQGKTWQSIILPQSTTPPNHCKHSIICSFAMLLNHLTLAMGDHGIIYRMVLPVNDVERNVVYKCLQLQFNSQQIA